MSQTLVLDLGNSRMKWGLYGPRGWMAAGVTSNTDIGSLALRDWQNLPRPLRAIGVNVAGEAARVRVEAQVARWRLTPQWLMSSAAACGVSNGYRTPTQLGPDRWASLIAARQRSLGADLFPSPAIVVNAGTAVTVDALDGEGRFVGGIILPGLRLMLRALAENTAALKVSAGGFTAFPDNTADALYSGAVQAVTGAIEQMRARLDEPERSARCFLAGGAAQELAPHLTGNVEVVDNLVLEGVLALAHAT
ncbi:MAG: type III pantothenate kinase [Pseudomonadota bacterium]|nr:type III pantothenate kinase [Pseudomonadota bacterium]